MSVKTDTYTDARYLDRVQGLLTQTLARLSSGSRINNPSDDPQAVGLAAKISAQNKRIQAATTNVQNATSYIQSADGMLNSMGEMVTRMSELSVLAKDVMKNGGDIALYQTEFTKIQDQLRVTIGGTTAEIGGTTSITSPMGTFNGIVVFGPNAAGTPVSTGEDPQNVITIPGTNLRTGGMLSLIQQDSAGNYTLSVTDATATDTINTSISQLADTRSTLGAVERRFELAGASLTKRGENMTKSLSDINDVDVAEESTRLSKFQALSEASTAMLAQANKSPEAVLRLLQQI
ncbi:MAG TPA: flagellin [Opitutaceae bacterium]|nr:flagellin [Opitutaceae bacterium]